MNANELRPLLVEYRSQVEQAWTVETAHPDFAGKAGPPVGQCGVTSLWLQKRLLEDHGIKTHFSEGPLHARGEVLRNHCWLETYGYTHVIDLTANQIAIDHASSTTPTGTRGASACSTSLSTSTRPPATTSCTAHPCWLRG